MRAEIIFELEVLPHRPKISHLSPHSTPKFSADLMDLHNFGFLRDFLASLMDV